MATWLASRACWVGAGHDLAARHDGRVRCLAVVWRLPIGLKHEGGQRSAAAFVGRQTRGRCDLVDRSWTRLGSEAQWTKSDESQMPCSRVAIGLKGACSVQRTSTAAFVGTHSGGKPGDAATLTHAHRHLLMTIDIDGPSVQGAAGSEAELQLGSFCHSQHAFDAHAVWLLWTDLHRICNLLAPRAPSVQGRASPYMCHAQVAVLSKPFSHAFLRGLKTYCLLSMRTRLFKRKVTKSL